SGYLDIMHLDYMPLRANFLTSGLGRMLYDDAGWPRLFRTTTPTLANSQPLVYYAENGADLRPIPGVRRKTLDQFLGQPRKDEFTFTPENYLGEHSFPLAFDYDPRVVYYASNVGHDTYGIYTLNLATKARTEVVAGVNVDLTGPDSDDPDRTL